MSLSWWDRLKDFVLGPLARDPEPPKWRVQPPPAVEPAPSPLDPVAELLGLHNQERARRGLGRLRPHPALQAAAEEQARWMADSGQVTHWGPDGSSVLERTERHGYMGGAVAENCAGYWRTPAEAVADWMRSHGHRANVLGPYTHAGFAVAESRAGERWWVGVFGRGG